MQDKYSSPQPPASCQALQTALRHRPTSQQAAFVILLMFLVARTPSVGTQAQSCPPDLACPYLIHPNVHTTPPLLFISQNTPVSTASCRSFPSILDPAQNCSKLISPSLLHLRSICSPLPPPSPHARCSCSPGWLQTLYVPQGKALNCNSNRLLPRARPRPVS